jgi:isocitrate dehydrogenase
MKPLSRVSPYGEKITCRNGSLVVPDQPIVPFIIGDGSGPDIWQVFYRVLNAAVERTYSKNRSISWLEVLAGQKAFDSLGT